MITAEDIISAMTEMKDERQRRILCRFFKTGKGQYGEGDDFLGIRVPQTRMVVKEAKRQVPFDEIKKLIYCPWHEIRLAGFLLLVEEMEASFPKRKSYSLETQGHGERRWEILEFYLAHARQANNWDLVDLSAPYILGGWLLHSEADHNIKYGILNRLCESDNLWEQRISIVSTLALVRHNDFNFALSIIERLLDHRHDLIHKAMGWVLREIGKKYMQVLTDFLELHFKSMPRTTLRYAIERMPESERKYWIARR